jgi:membrane-bound lytic murein transglycosylase B
MIGWKKAASQAAAFGAAFAVVLCIVAGAWIWYPNSPRRQAAWNSTAIRATFKEITVSTSPQQPAKETFSYVLENTTDADYSLDPSRTTLETSFSGIRFGQATLHRQRTPSTQDFPKSLCRSIDRLQMDAKVILVPQVEQSLVTRSAK